MTNLEMQTLFFDILSNECREPTSENLEYESERIIDNLRTVVEDIAEDFGLDYVPTF